MGTSLSTSVSYNESDLTVVGQLKSLAKRVDTFNKARIKKENELDEKYTTMGNTVATMNSTINYMDSNLTTLSSTVSGISADMETLSAEALTVNNVASNDSVKAMLDEVLGEEEEEPSGE